MIPSAVKCDRQKWDNVSKKRIFDSYDLHMKLEDSEQYKLFAFQHDTNTNMFLLFKADDKICEDDEPRKSQERLLFIDGEVDVSGITRAEMIELFRSQIKADEAAHQKGYILHPIHSVLTIATEFIEVTENYAEGKVSIEFKGERQPNYKVNNDSTKIVIDLSKNLITAGMLKFHEYAPGMSVENKKKIEERSFLQYVDQWKPNIWKMIDSTTNTEETNVLNQYYYARHAFSLLIGKGEMEFVYNIKDGKIVKETRNRIQK